MKIFLVLLYISTHDIGVVMIPMQTMDICAEALKEVGPREGPVKVGHAFCISSLGEVDAG